MTGRTYSVSLTVNGRPHTLDVPAHHTLLRALREQLDLVGTKECCTEGECGACTVLVDGQAVDSCLMLAVEAAGAEITTIEGLADGDRLDPLQAAFLETGAVQCGFCTPGMILTAYALLLKTPKPTHDEIIRHMDDNLCRCGAQVRIVDAIQDAAGVAKGGAL